MTEPIQQTPSAKDEADWRYPYDSKSRYHLHHPHLICRDVDVTIDFYTRWFDAEVIWDGEYAGTRNVFLKIGQGAMHLYEKEIDPSPRNAVHHLGIQIVGLQDLYDRMQKAGIPLRNPIRHNGGGGYFMVQAPDQVLLELFEPGPERDPIVQRYYGFDMPSSE
ncbi:VOC family protein [Orrella sp. 11846]|uniref:VOC family protein n=1 Tax=Orrella sp. 11846 TaxID=3409913 RepID=UPI003B5A2717